MVKSVVFVGTGIKAISHLTVEAKATISQADMVGYLVNEPVVEKWIADHSVKAYSFQDLYFSEKKRDKSYEKIAEKIITLSDKYNSLCIAIYGHPSIYSNSALNASKVLSEKGRNVVFLPGISVRTCKQIKLCPNYFANEATLL